MPWLVMHLSKEELDKLRKMRQNMLLHDDAPHHSASHPTRKPKPDYSHLKLKFKDKRAPGSQPVGRDVPGAHEAEAKKALHDTVQILPHQSALNEELRKTYNINFAENALDTLRQLTAMRVNLIFFTVKGWAMFPMLHCANRNAYAADIDFQDALYKFYQNNPDSFYDASTMQWLVGSEQMTELFNFFDEHDRNRFSEVTGWILRHGQFGEISFIGHDRRPTRPSVR